MFQDADLLNITNGQEMMLIIYTQVYSVISVTMTHINTHTGKIDTTMKHIVGRGWNQMSKTEQRLKEAERILITVLEDESVTSREYLVALVITYFSNSQEVSDDNEHSKG